MSDCKHIWDEGDEFCINCMSDKCLVDRIKELEAENERLRGSIENAPHHASCWGGMVDGRGEEYPCNCWKAQEEEI